MQDLKALEGKSLAELREIAKALGIKNVMIKKRELIEKIAGTDTPEEAPAENEAGAKGEVSETAAKPAQEAAPQTAAPKAKAGSYDLAPTGAAGATLNLKAQGDAKNVKEDIAKDKTVATITWTFAAGNAAGGISVDDSWEGNHEMGID